MLAIGFKVVSELEAITETEASTESEAAAELQMDNLIACLTF